MAVLNKKGIKTYFKKEGMKIGDKALNKFIKIQEARISLDAEKAIRNSKISGRKVLNEEDFSLLGE